MELTIGNTNGLVFVEGTPEELFMARASDVNRVIEACLSEGAGAAILYAPNMSPAFFDLSSGEAGEILQKLRNYRIRLAIVAASGSVKMSSRFGEMVADERRGSYFGMFETRAAAIEWLGKQ